MEYRVRENDNGTYNRYTTIHKGIMRAIEKDPMDKEAYRDWFAMSKEWEEYRIEEAHYYAKELREKALQGLQIAEGENVDVMYGIYKRAMLFDAPVEFDAYLQYIEIDKPFDKKFYAPRRHYLKPMVEAFQDVLEGKLKLLTLSMPKRSGKSQTGINFVNMISGRNPDKATLMEGAGTALVDSFYKGCLEYLRTPNEYLYYDIFPEAKLVETNADNRTINLNGKRRFPTIMCRSIDAIQVGLSEATNLLYLDDCVEGREEAQNRTRLDNKWEAISGDIMGRLIEGTPMVMTGTRYSLYDPIGRAQDFAREKGWKWRAIEIPALDIKTDESNYEYIREGKHVFTTAYFREQRDLLSAEQFESEFQQQPFEAKGLVLPPKELNYFFALPTDVEPDSVIAVCDTAESGSDSTSMPIAYIYGEDIYIVDVVFDNSPPDVTKPKCANMLMKHKVANVTFESNNGGNYYAGDVEELVRKNGGRVGVRTKRTITNKKTRIEFASDNIKKHFFFLDPSTVSHGSDYAMFFREATTYTRTGKNLHDDAIDALSLLENEIRNSVLNVATIVNRPF